MALGDFVQRLFGPPRRETGRPPSANGASSLHLFWVMPAGPLREVSAVIEVIDRPRVDRLYFWALQASFDDDHGEQGAGHLGLQHHPRYPDAGAVNWGGYHGRASGQRGELPGSTLRMTSSLDNANTGDFRWEQGRRYRYRIGPSPERGWRGSIVDLASGDETVIRDLWAGGTHLARPMVWTEAFADCDHPPAAVRWSDLEAVTPDGETVRPLGLRVNYQKVADGGCSNTNADADGAGGVVQRTGTVRQTAQDAVIRL